MEESILELEYRLDRVETELLLLEKRLENVPDTDVVPSTSSIEKPTEKNITTTSNVELTSETKHEQIILPEVPLESEQKLEEKEENGEPVVKIKDHPSYAMYFKMLKLGVPEAAVRQKMITEGIDPSILSKPDAPAPMLPSKSQKKDLARHSDSDVHSDSSFSGAD
uniref:Uncharacterized protein n=1 Tax=Acrobeloides nanus TaxID=290746 RepID=A0A914BWG4_9BILA